MSRVHWFLAFALLLVPGVSHAIQLHWRSGADTLAFTEATRCTLVVEADPAEQRLPSEWRLLWVAVNCPRLPLVPDSVLASGESAAQVCGMDTPAPAEAAVNATVARFCSEGTSPASAARYILDLPAGSRGKFQVVSFVPQAPDSSTCAVIRSLEVTFNGGFDAAYPPSLYRVVRTHDSAQLTVEATGTGLAAVRSAGNAAPDTSWRFPLDIVAQSDSSLTAVAYLAADLPTSVLEVAAEPGGASASMLAPDPPALPMAPIGSSGTMVPGDSIQPKDFAFIFQPQVNIFHLFYIWQDRKMIAKLGGAGYDSTEKFLGHAWSTDLLHWTQMDSVLAVRPGEWDNFHVWAPSIIQKGPTYFMFYTGVTRTGPQGLQIQRIGVATADATTPGDSLKTWTRGSTWIFSHNNVPWAYHDTTKVFGQQFRDPFVMADPESVGHYLMYYVTVPKYDTLSYVVGVGKSAGDLTNWRNYGPMHSTDHAAVPMRASSRPTRCRTTILT
mgnify:CR=1 FL=1